MCVDACPKQLGDADHVAGYPINMHWEKKAQTPARQPRCSKIEIEIENNQNNKCHCDKN